MPRTNAQSFGFTADMPAATVRLICVLPVRTTVVEPCRAFTVTADPLTLETVPNAKPRFAGGLKAPPPGRRGTRPPGRNRVAAHFGAIDTRVAVTVDPFFVPFAVTQTPFFTSDRVPGSCSLIAVF